MSANECGLGANGCGLGPNGCVRVRKSAKLLFKLLIIIILILDILVK